MLSINRRMREAVLIIDLEGRIDGSPESQQILDSIKDAGEQQSDV